MTLAFPHLWLLTLLLVGACAAEEACPIAQYYQFYNKENLSPEPIIPDPYAHPTPQYLARVQENLQNKQRVCALKYADSNKQSYQLRDFDSRAEAQQQGWIVTHQGVCGKCSSTRDLYVYLTTDLTRPVRACGLRNFYSPARIRACIKELGFTDACTQVWLWNTLQTKKKCGGVCFVSYVRGQPYVVDGELNKCLECDQEKSGPIFKYESGRTRRNSGIKSEIDRPSDQIYNLIHCYY